MDQFGAKRHREYQRDELHEGVLCINIYLLRPLYILMFFVLGKEACTHILPTKGHGNQ